VLKAWLKKGVITIPSNSKDPCIIPPISSQPMGYVQMKGPTIDHDHRKGSVHIQAYCAMFGMRPLIGSCVSHRCGLNGCITPSHLIQETQTQRVSRIRCHNDRVCHMDGHPTECVIPERKFQTTQRPAQDPKQIRKKKRAAEMRKDEEMVVPVILPFNEFYLIALSHFGAQLRSPIEFKFEQEPFLMAELYDSLVPPAKDDETRFLLWYHAAEALKMQEMRVMLCAEVHRTMAPVVLLLYLMLRAVDEKDDKDIKNAIVKSYSAAGFKLDAPLDLWAAFFRNRIIKKPDAIQV
jgi:hypothetical protein